MKSLLENELARADAIIADGNNLSKKAHQPTLDHFKGQAFAFRKVLSWLEMEKILPRDPIKVQTEVRITIPWISVALIAISGIMYLLC